MNMNKCQCTGKFLSNKRVKFLKDLEIARQSSYFFAGLLAIVATAICVY